MRYCGKLKHLVIKWQEGQFDTMGTKREELGQHIVNMIRSMQSARIELENLGEVPLGVLEHATWLKLLNTVPCPIGNTPILTSSPHIVILWLDRHYYASLTEMRNLSFGALYELRLTYTPPTPPRQSFENLVRLLRTAESLGEIYITFEEGED